MLFATKTLRACMAAGSLVVGLAGMTPTARAADEPAKAAAEPSPQPAKKAEAKPTSSPKDQEADALALVSEHHPELLDLLKQLKADNPKQYQQAIVELHRASQRLSQRKVKDPPRYELELKAWKLDSQARLLAAKLAMDADAKLESRLMAVLLEREDVAIELLELERSRISDRMQQSERQLAQRRQQRETRAKLAFEQLSRRSSKARLKGQIANGPPSAAKKPKPGKPRRIDADVPAPKAGQIEVAPEAANKSQSVVKPPRPKK